MADKAIKLNTDAGLIESIGWTKKQSPCEAFNEIFTPVVESR